MALPDLPDRINKLDKKSRRRVTRWSIIGGNVLLLLIVAIFLLVNRSASSTVRSSTVGSVVSTAGSVSGPLDALSSDQIALQAAQMTNLPELNMVRNRADSTAILLSLIPNDSTTLAKPQVVTTAEKSRYDIIHYNVQPGDSVGSLATKFGVSANAIKWSNGLNTDSLTVGNALLIPPAEGIIYGVKSGDTVESIVSRYHANQNTFITVNDAEKGVTTGELVWIPNGIQPVVITTSSLSFSLGTSTGAHRYGSCAIASDIEGYPCGWCTWWSAYRRAQIGAPVSNHLGDAITWRYGMTPDPSPQPGDVVWFPYDHVAFVESVNADGSANISEMNEVGWDVVSYRTLPANASGVVYLNH